MVNAADADLVTTGRTVDNLVSAEIRVRSNLPYGILEDLHAAAVDDAGGPLCLAAARALAAAVAPGDTVVVATGAGGPPWLPHGETDGPLGAIGLARALCIALGARPVVTAEERVLPSLVSVARACGIAAVSPDRLAERSNAAAVVPYPEEQPAGEKAADRLLDQHDPAAVVAVEKGAPNAAGVYHSATGSSMDDSRAKIAPLFERAADRGVPTVGIGDNGNEIGFGRIEDAVREVHPYGDDCGCPCGAGVASAVATDHLVVCNTSNWGAHGVAAMLGILADVPEALHAPDDEARMLEQAVLQGSADGVFARPVARVDGTSAAAQQGIVALLRDVVVGRQTAVHREF